MAASRRPRKRKKGDAKDRVIAELRAQVEALLKCVADLEARLKQNSTNSDKPPSSDPPDAPRPGRKRKSGRAPGGQPGRQGKTRKLLPEDKVDGIHEHKPSACRGCGKRLRGSDPAPRRHQVADLPPIRPVVNEHRLHALKCSGCGTTTRAEPLSGRDAKNAERL